MKHVISCGIYAEEAYEIVGINHVAFGFGHLVLPGKQPRVTENLLGQRQAERHQKNRPVDRVETQNVLSDQVKIGGP